jgi:hypothetical protein
MQKPELSEEDLERVRKVTTTGIHSVQRKPFRPLVLLVILMAIVGGLSLLSQWLADFKISA